MLSATAAASTFQNPLVRSRYQTASWGKFAGHVMMSCEADRYAQKMTKANISLPSRAGSAR